MTSAVLKVIAMLTMFVDHCGSLLFPDVAFLRIIGRLAMPIFAFCIAEGCKYSKDKLQYLLRVLMCAASFQIVANIVSPGYSLCVVWAYAAAVGFSILSDWSAKKEGVLQVLPLLYAVVVGLALMALKVEYYGFPFFLILAFQIKKPWLRWLVAATVLGWISIFYQWQYWGLLAIPLLMLYNGKKGRVSMGKFMYYFYPLHYLLIGLLSFVI